MWNFPEILWDFWKVLQNQFCDKQNIFCEDQEALKTFSPGSPNFDLLGLWICGKDAFDILSKASYSKFGVILDFEKFGFCHISRTKQNFENFSAHFFVVLCYSFRKIIYNIQLFCSWRIFLWLWLWQIWPIIASFLTFSYMNMCLMYSNQVFMS